MSENSGGVWILLFYFYCLTVFWVLYYVQIWYFLLMYFSNIDYISKTLDNLLLFNKRFKTLNVNRKAYLKSFSKQVTTGIENLPIQILCKAYYKYFTVALKTEKKCNNN